MMNGDRSIRYGKGGIRNLRMNLGNFLLCLNFDRYYFMVDSYLFFFIRKNVRRGGKQKGFPIICDNHIITFIDTHTFVVTRLTHHRSSGLTTPKDNNQIYKNLTMKLRLPGGINFASPSQTRNNPDNDDGGGSATTSLVNISNNNSPTSLSCQLRRKSSSLFDSPRKALKKKSCLKKESRNDSCRSLSASSSTRRELSPKERREAMTTLSSSLFCPHSGSNVLQWLHDDAPLDIVPKILSFLGSRKILLLSLTCRSWRDVCLSDGVWRTVSEDMRKWKNGDEMPSSWLSYYCDNPCVPIDFNSIESALRFTSANGPSSLNTQPKKIRILLHPGRYVISRSLIINTLGLSNVTVETLQTPTTTYSFVDDTEPETRRRLKMRVPSASSLRNMLNCRSSSATMTTTTAAALPSPAPDNDYPPSPPQHPQTTPPSSLPSRATIILNTRKHNEPIFRVTKGRLDLLNLKLVHNCTGTDIWNGNAAVQIQPPLDHDDAPLPLPPPPIAPRAHLHAVEITSVSGRGVVAIDGGRVVVRACLIRGCAATGLYVGGPGSVASMDRTDVVANGHGNEGGRRGGRDVITRGHSGVYLEQGVAVIHDCNISNNSLTGISAVSPENAFLTVEGTDMVGNGSVQLEMPPVGSVSRMSSVNRDNVFGNEGSGRMRSGIVREGEEGGGREVEQQRSPLISGMPVHEGHHLMVGQMVRET